ncbi:hypothetical protein CVT26_001339 [Gymnopilus dilepis]|uniref:DUF5648 domain-containing protein n=1 Tax=Gymnopilus dilepis TaxID=231916 RepID=A0A409YUN9_9AGAR|nr:hypothetical protein CVT26_001339 [Gymnopilus dilepis]
MQIINFSTISIPLFLNAVNVMSSSLSSSLQPRTANTCADPTTPQTFYGAFGTSVTSHNFQTRAAFVNEDNTASEVIWQIQGAIFKAWTSPDTNILPLYLLATPGFNDVVILNSTSPAGDPPTLAGFSTAQLLAYAYPTQICGSVPLFGLSKASTTDHWYTTDEVERNVLINSFGWADLGIVAFVLPVDGKSNIETVGKSMNSLAVPTQIVDAVPEARQSCRREWDCISKPYYLSYQ